MVTRIAAIALCAALCACGGLDTPDLSRGAVAGRVAGASAGAYAYVYGAPQLRASLAPDGSFEIDGVPAGAASVVLFDGADRAEMVAVQVQGATRTRVDRTAAAMPVAGGIVAAARPAGGTVGYGAAFGVDGTVLSGVPAASGAFSALMWPLPGGTYQARASLSGFVDGGAAAVVVPGVSTGVVEVGLGVDLSAPAPGCVGKTCRSPLKCEPLDGRCYQCLASADCAAGQTCDQHVCVPATGPRQICAPCTFDTECAGGKCFPTDPSGPRCSQPCLADADCPAGFTCSSNACIAPHGCAALTATFGAPCLEYGACDDALKLGWCVGLAGPGTTGYCSAPCTLTGGASCSGAVGLPSCTAGYCGP